MSAVLVIFYILVAAGLVTALVFAVRRFKKGGACCGGHSKVVKTKVSDMNKAHYPHEAKASISGMMCGNCAAKVQNALNGLPGTWAKVKLDTKQAEILSKSPVDEQAVRHAVHQAGYCVSDLQVVK